MNVPLTADVRDHATAVRPGEELDLGALGAFLTRQFPEHAGPLSVEQFPSGHSNLTYLIRFGEREMVLRRPPFGTKVKSAHDMSREYRVLSKLHPVYPPAPHVLVYCDDASVLGAPFYLMERISGFIMRRDPPPGLPFTEETARRLSESFLDNLVRLHGLDYERIGLGDLGKPQGYLERQVRGWIDRYHGSETHNLPDVERIAPWLIEHMPSTTDATLIHNDYKYDNVVLDPNDITHIIGVLDWEMSTIGDPLTDLGTTIAYWLDPHDSAELRDIRWCPSMRPGSLTRAQLVERYVRATGRDSSNMVFYLTFACFKIAVILQQIYYRYHHGLTHDERFAAMPERIRILVRASLDTIESNSI